MLRILDPLPIGAQHVVGLHLHALNLAAHQSAGGHQRRGQMGLAGLVQLRGHTLALNHIGHLHHAAVLGGGAAAAAQQLPGSKSHHRHDQNHGDDVDDVELSNAFCFLFHGLLRKRRGRACIWRLSSGQYLVRIV